MKLIFLLKHLQYMKQSNCQDYYQSEAKS